MNPIKYAFDAVGGRSKAAALLNRTYMAIAGGPWSAGRKRKQISYDSDREDTAHVMGYTIVRLESAARFKINESGPLQIQAHFASQWLENLKRQIFNGDQTIPSNGLS